MADEYLLKRERTKEQVTFQGTDAEAKTRATKEVREHPEHGFAVVYKRLGCIAIDPEVPVTWVAGTPIAEPA